MWANAAEEIYKKNNWTRKLYLGNWGKWNAWAVLGKTPKISVKALRICLRNGNQNLDNIIAKIFTTYTFSLFFSLHATTQRLIFSHLDQRTEAMVSSFFCIYIFLFFFSRFTLCCSSTAQSCARFNSITVYSLPSHENARQLQRIWYMPVIYGVTKPNFVYSNNLQPYLITKYLHDAKADKIKREWRAHTALERNETSRHYYYS